MKRIVILILFILLVLGCNKHPIVVNKQLAPKVIVNGYISDQVEFQTFDLFYSSNINDTIAPPILNASVELEQLGLTYSFIGNDSGTYASIIPFSCNNGEVFLVKYKVDTSILEMSHIMPEPINIDSVKINFSNFYHSISIDLSTTANQYVILKVFDSFFDSITMQTMWQETVDNNNLPIYEIEPGQNELLISDNEFSSLDSGKVIKIEAIAISNQVAQYLIALKEYSETIATSSLFVNPPRFYPNEFYGVTYGLSSDTISDTL
ncbi:MAG: DUF4249 family protein [Crocinitomicaceae bacterium]